jgi:hypothetical protein
MNTLQRLDCTSALANPPIEHVDGELAHDAEIQSRYTRLAGPPGSNTSIPQMLFGFAVFAFLITVIFIVVLL